VVVHVFDVLCTVFHVSAPRLSDYSTVPVAFAFALAEVNRYAGLFGELEEKVRERTKDLARANEKLTREHAEREALQRRLAEAERLEALGHLAGSVAHDFNNLLTVVMGSNQGVAHFAGDIPAVAEACADIQTAAERGTALVRQLLTFARRQPSTPKNVDLEAQARNLLPLLEPLAGKHVRVRLETDGPAQVLIDPTQFDQILMNLVVNARAAMPKGGEVTIRLDRAAPAEVSEATEPAEERSVVRVRVSDTGLGIPAEVLPRIFEPFFTTKAEHGTGLGLDTVLRATREAGGTISVDSTPGAGTTFQLLLPAQLGEPCLEPSIQVV
jgi:signal transduction histidine kinase